MDATILFCFSEVNYKILDNERFGLLKAKLGIFCMKIILRHSHIRTFLYSMGTFSDKLQLHPFMLTLHATITYRLPTQNVYCV